jgi:hypothetical protein
MNVACIIGAGYSFVAGLPLTNDLFNVDVTILSESVQKRFNRVWRDYHAWRTANPDKNLEQYLQALYENRFGFYLSPPFSHAVELVAVALATTLDVPTKYRDTRYGNSRLIYPSKNSAHRALWNTIVSSFTNVGVVTTNYDLFIERSLRHRPMKRGFGTGFYYGGLKQPQLLQGKASPFTVKEPQTGIQLEGNIPVCKLHGSLNWSLDDGGLRLYQDLRPALRNGNEAAIVPPVSEKDIPDWLTPVWFASEKVLSEADTWIICGYSLPSYDSAINDLLRSTAKSNLKHIYILDPLGEQLREKYNRIAPDSDIVCLSGLPDGTQELAKLLKDDGI